SPSAAASPAPSPNAAATPAPSPSAAASPAPSPIAVATPAPSPNAEATRPGVAAAPGFTPTGPAPIAHLPNPARAAQLAHHPPTSLVEALPYQPPHRSTLLQDLLLGVTAAGLIVAGVLGGRALFGTDKMRGTLVVTVSPAVA